MTSTQDDVVLDPAGLTGSWLTGVLGRPVTDAVVEPVGTGQIGTCFRVRFSTPSGPDTLIAKLPAADPGLRDMLAGAYRGEVRFYTEIAPTVAARVPALLHAGLAETGGGFTLLLEDLAPWRQGDQIAGCSVAQAHDAVVNLAGLHGPRWCDPALPAIDGLSLNGPDEAQMLADVYAPAVDTFVTDLGSLLDPADVDVLRRSTEVIHAWALARQERFAPVHGDYRLDNLLFPDDGTQGVCAVDWQTVSLALPGRDLAYAVATSLPVETRREHERSLVAAYHEALVLHGVTDHGAEEAWDDYAFGMLQGPLVAVLGCIYGTRTDRGDRMFATMIRRSCTAVRDLNTLDLV